VLPCLVILTLQPVARVLHAPIWSGSEHRELRLPLSATPLGPSHTTDQPLSILPAPLSHCPRNSFPHNLLADPHPLNPVVSIFYKNSGGGGRFFLTSLPPYFLTSKSERLNHVPQTQHFS